MDAPEVLAAMDETIVSPEFAAACELEFKHGLGQTWKAANPWKPTLSDTLRDAYAALRAATEAAYYATGNVGAAKRILTERRQEILRTANPKGLGANEAQREAAIAEMTRTDASYLAHCEEASRIAGLTLELARLDVEAARAQLRCSELGAAIARER